MSRDILPVDVSADLRRLARLLHDHADEGTTLACEDLNTIAMALIGYADMVDQFHADEVDIPTVPLFSPKKPVLRLIKGSRPSCPSSSSPSSISS